MGKSPKPLQWLIPDGWGDLKVVQEKAAQGHLFVEYCDVESYCLADFDCVVGPGCWRVADSATFEKYFNLIERGGREIRYPVKPATTVRQS